MTGVSVMIKCIVAYLKLWSHASSNYRVEIGAVGIKNLEDLANRNSSVTVRTLIY